MGKALPAELMRTRESARTRARAQKEKYGKRPSWPCCRRDAPAKAAVAGRRRRAAFFINPPCARAPAAAGRGVQVAARPPDDQAPAPRRHSEVAEAEPPPVSGRPRTQQASGVVCGGRGARASFTRLHALDPHPVHPARPLLLHLLLLLCQHVVPHGRRHRPSLPGCPPPKNRPRHLAPCRGRAAPGRPPALRRARHAGGGGVHGEDAPRACAYESRTPLWGKEPGFGARAPGRAVLERSARGMFINFPTPDLALRPPSLAHAGGGRRHDDSSLSPQHTPS